MRCANRQTGGMRIIFSRKGFDSTSGGGPSPIVNGRPVSLPIPATRFSETTYGSLGLEQQVRQASRGRHDAGDLCHHDPMFLPGGECLFGQAGAAQTHLLNEGVRPGDVFLFFGLFADELTGERHHRIFGWMKIVTMRNVAELSADERRSLVARGHPHALGMHGRNDAIWSGPGGVATSATGSLRLTVPGGPCSLWKRPSWLRPGGLSYHDRPDRWQEGGRLLTVSRGQEFVAPIGRRQAPRRWLAERLAEMNG